MPDLVVLAAAIAAIVCVNWFFLAKPKAGVAAATTSGGVQQVAVSVEGGYTPSVVHVRAGVPVRMVFDRKEKSPCSEEVVIGGLGIKRFLKPFEQTTVEFTPAEAGRYEFTCGMGMLRGAIVVEG